MMPLMPPMQVSPVTPAPSAFTGLLPLPISPDATKVAIKSDIDDIHAKIMASLPKPAAKPSRAEPREKSYQYITQHCANGAHENSRLLSSAGTLFTACRGTYKWRFTQAICTCWCHAMFASLQAEDGVALSVPSTGTVTAVTPVSGHAGPVESLGTNTPPTTPPLPDGMKNAHLANHPVYKNALQGDNVESQLAKYVYHNVFGLDEPSNETLLGRRKRGELDVQVELVCRLWLDGFLNVGEMLTIDWICMMINAADQPSPGAIHSVLTRWAEHNLCMIGKSPMRFMSFSPAVDQQGVATVRKDQKREAEKRAKGFF